MKHARMPCHITILYVHSIVSLAALFHATLVAAEIVVIPLHTNSTPELKHIFDQELSFSAMIPDEGVPGRLEIASPLTACSAIRPPPFPSNDSFAWFVLIARFECGLAEKARFAQDAGYDVAVIYDRKAHNNGPFETHITPEPKYYPAKARSEGSPKRVAVGVAGRDENDLNIYAVIVSEESGIRLKRYTYKDDYEVKLYPETYQSLFNYLVPFLVVIGLCIGCLLCFMMWRYFRDWRRKRRSRLSRRHLRKLPVTKFKKGAPYETCAICIEDFVEGDKLRTLPCSHAYHCKCIEPWLLENRRTCPICKRKVVLPGMDPDSDSESEADAPHSERTPLLSGGGGGGGGGTFDSPPPRELPRQAPPPTGHITVATATFHCEDGASHSLPTHVSTAHSLNRDTESGSSSVEEEVAVRPARPSSSYDPGIHSVLS
ncbi:hypothetical protein HPB47_002409 [Ixodes persulcatus]|uniref:Uncharacterized protein n=1 Tax=Ixodes persulcatus TaxID=34615 RepID=A0AC60PL94_IXOPE|nr:hypothetical protein HPB47_002409 [Ixodes persulcatus]